MRRILRHVAAAPIIVGSSVVLAAALLGPAQAVDDPRGEATDIVDTLEGGSPSCDDAVPVVSFTAGSACGIVRTTVRGQESQAYLGIPYAEPPVGDLRWKPPVALAGLGDGTYPATTYQSSCVAPGPGPTGFVGNEDCLYLNVYAPRGTSGASSLPVLVYIPGGGFVSSQSNLELDGTALANQGLIVVSVSYRLGSLGFFRAIGEDYRFEGNQGIQDQQLALRWVQDNIGSFGGDPAQVTVFGESAGAMSVGTHLFVAPSSKDLFRAAIMESNIAGMRYSDRQQAASIGADFVHLLCRSYADDVRRCEERPRELLSGLTTAQIAQAENLTLPPGGMPGLVTLALTNGHRAAWGPTVGVAPLVNQQPVLGFAPGVTPKPYAFGVNATEGAFFLPSPSTLTSEQYRDLLVESFGAKRAQTILDFREDKRRIYSPAGYRPLPGGGLTPASRALARLQTDFFVVSANILTVENALPASKKAGTPIFGYHFLKRSSFDFTGLQRCAFASENVCHTDEIPYVWSDFVEKDATGRTVPVRDVSPEDLALGARMTGDWAAFAKDPNSGLGGSALTAGNDRQYVTYRAAEPTPAGQLLPKAREDLWMPIIRGVFED